MDELLLFPQAEHDDLFDGLQTMVEGSMQNRSHLPKAGGRKNIFCLGISRREIRRQLDDFVGEKS